MGKKAKFAPEVEVAAVAVDAVEIAAEVPAEVSVKRASLTLVPAKEGAASVSFNVRPASRMKGGNASVSLTIGGVATATKCSDTSRVAVEGKVLTRLWLTLPSGEFGYVLTDYGMDAAGFVEAYGSEFTVVAGRATRTDPKRELKVPIVRKKAEVAVTEPVEAAAEGEAAEA